MKQNIGKLIDSIRQLTTTVRAEREVRRKMFPHLNHEPEAEYSFGSRDEMVKSFLHAALDIEADLRNIARTAADMPKPHGDMFCYVAYCDLHERMRMYQRLAEELVQADTNALVQRPSHDVAVIT